MARGTQHPFRFRRHSRRGSARPGSTSGVAGSPGGITNPDTQPATPATDLPRRALTWWTHGALALTLTLTLATTTPVPADSAAPPAKSPEDLGYSVRLWTVEDGLPTVFLAALSQTPDGYLWWPNPWGMARFDGVRLKTFLLDHQPSSPSRVLYSLSDSVGRIWAIGDSAIGVFRDGAMRWVPNPAADVEPSRFFACPAGSGWCGVQHGSGTRLLHMPAGPDDGVDPFDLPIRATGVAEDQDQRVWLSCDGDAVEVLFSDDGTPPGLRPAGLEEAVGHSFFRRQDGSIAIAGARAIFVLRNGAWTRGRPFSSVIDSELAQTTHDRFDQYWMGTRSSGLWLSTPGGWTGRVELPGFILKEGFGIGAVLCDRESSIWVGTRHGLYQLQRVGFRPVFRSTEAVESEFVDVTPLAGGGAWATTESGHVYQFDSPDAVPTLIGPPPFGVRFLERTAEGTTWLASDETVWAFDGGTPRWSTRFADAGVRSPYVLSLAALGDTAWISLAGAGLWRAHNQTLALEPLPVDAPRSANAQVAVNQRGEIRAFVDGAGLCAVQNQTWTLLPTPDRVLDSHHSGLHVDPEGRTWLYGNDPPIFRHHTNGWTEIPLRRGEVPVEVIAAASDDLGGLWALTRGHGVVRVHRDPSPDSAEQGQEWFGVGDGLPSVAGRGWSKGVVRGPDGLMWFTTALGVAVIDPRERRALRNESKPPTVLLEELLLDNHPLDWQAGQPVVIPSSAHRIEIHFTAIGLKNPSQNRFRYRLEGLEDAWTAADSGRVAVYQKPPPGRYRFQVIAANCDGVWNTSGAAFALRVLPHWSQTTSFRALVAALVLGGLWTARSLKLRQLARDQARREEFTRQLLATQEEERRRIAHELHDSLGQEMLVLKGRIELASLRNPESKPFLDPLSDGFAETIERARSLSQSLRPPHLEHFGLSKALEGLAMDLQNASTFEVLSDIEDLEPRLPGQAEIGLFRIAQEAVANALKHSGAKRVWISLNRSEGTARLTVRDDGRGFVPSTSRKVASLGLRGMSERIALLGGTLQCAAQPGHGVTISVQLRASGTPEP